MFFFNGLFTSLNRRDQTLGGYRQIGTAGALCWWECEMVSPLWKQTSTVIRQKAEHRITINPTLLILEAGTLTNSPSPSSQGPRGGAAKCPPKDERINRTRPSLQLSITQSSEEGGPDTCYNTDGAGGRSPRCSKDTFAMTP